MAKENNIYNDEIKMFANLMNYKEHAKLLRDSDSFLKRLAYFFSMVSWRSMRSVYKLCFSRPYRSQLYLKFLGSPEVHQLSNYTANNRYPDIFLLLLNHFGANSSFRILSYGCSTGEEVFTLRKYFPNAKIIGVDINRGNIKKCLNRNNDKNNRFYLSDDEQWKEDEYDIILSMAVLQSTKNRNPETTDSSKIYPFSKFNTKLSELDAYLKTNGVLVIEHSDYRFTDSDIAVNYAPLEKDQAIARDRPVYNRNNIRINDAILTHRIFVKS